MPFRDALSRLKGKLKKGLKIGSKDESPTPSSANLSTASILAPVGLLTPYSPTQLALNAPAASTDHELPSNYIPKSDGHFGTTGTALLGTQPDIRLLDGNPTSQVPRAISDSQLGPVESPLPVNHAVENSTGVDKDDQPAKYPPPENDKVDSKAGIGWTGAKLFLQALNAGVNAIPPLKSAIGELNECFNIYERTNKGRNDYGHLLNRTDELLGELQGYIQDREAIEMTQSVKRVCSQLDLEVKSLKAKLEGPTAQQLLEAVDAPDQITECHGRIQQLLQRLNLNATMNILTKIDIQQEKMNKQEELIRRKGMERRLRELLPALSSTYNSAESDDIKRGGCTQGTRQPQIESLLEWALNPHTGRICWMNGMAGTGKTTIAYSVCSALEQRSALGASFFCSRSIPECRQVKHIIPTIAYQIARYSLPFRFALDKVLESSPDARTQALRTQYEKLIVKPLTEVQDYLPTDFIVVIDALDECENESSLGLVLDLLISPELTLPIRFLVSSRPEPEILSRMKDNA
ncbi:unnamed protein product [Rhizoctonia solani]|uniref:NACHT domain-containing protein n=1 Tax=Rhizoctonia solani TaxID=456999 RepID=A0A8H3H7G1_9AGAM|nr:unnamed protein product [Rhizoctonia solani]